MRKYGNTLKTLRGVEAKVKQLNTSGMLPHGYKIVPYYDRTALVQTTLHTVMENLTIGMALVFLVLIFFLGNFKAALIAAVNIPLGLCGAFILMKVSDTPANLISLGAVDFGIIIDTTVIVMENINRHLSSSEFSHESAGGRILRAAQEVGGPMLFSTLIFVIAFLPLFTMRGVEGAIFSPMSHTFAYALATAILLAVTLTPVLGSFAFARGLSHINNPVWNASFDSSSVAYHTFGCCSKARRPRPRRRAFSPFPVSFDPDPYGTLLRCTWKFAVVNTQSTSSFDRGLLRMIQIVAAHRHQRGLRRWANCFGK
jgi:Cu/Ag efflux pump CusA